jgi:hypothetical protein
MVLPKWKTETIHWTGDKARILEAWLAEVDKNDEADLFRRLYEWKLSERFDWRKRDARGQQIMADLQARFRVAATPAQRQTVLRKFDLWFQLDEENACSLYERDARAASAYILRRLPGSWLGGDKRKLWGRLIAFVEANKDEGKSRAVRIDPRRWGPVPRTGKTPSRRLEREFGRRLFPTGSAPRAGCVPLHHSSSESGLAQLVRPRQLRQDG